MEVDNVARTYASAQALAHGAAKQRHHVMALSATRTRPFYNHSGKPFTYNGKLNNRGRWTWMVKVAPIPKGFEVLDYLPAGATRACWTTETNGESMVWIQFAELVHHKTLEKIMHTMALTVMYVRGCKKVDIDNQFGVTGCNKLVRN